jgi:hypothetical protein
MPLLFSPRRTVALGLVFALLAPALSAEPLSKKTEIDFYHDVPSRNLKGLAARTDGRLVAGPTLVELNGVAPADLFWCLEPTNESGKWLIGTGPDGRIFEITLDALNHSTTSHELVKLDEPHVFSLAHLPDGAVLAGTSPKGALCLIRNGKLAARVALPVDSIFDLLVLDANTVLAATGNPARIYKIDMGKFAAAPVKAEKITDPKLLAEHGITLFGEVRDRNIRRLARLTDGRIAAGSAPKGNVYAFPAAGGAPLILLENRDAEVTDLLVADGGLYATLTFSGGSGETRLTPPKAGKEPIDPPVTSLSSAEKFNGRSNLVWIPDHGFPETLTSRGNAAFYRMARQGSLLVLTGGEQGEVLGYDLHERLSLTFAGSNSAQLSGLRPIPGQSGRFLILRNNAPGLAVLDFAGASPREAETRRIDLGAQSLLGALRFNRLREVADRQLAIEIRTSSGSDELEGWSAWTPLKSAEGGWTAGELRGRYVKLRLKLPADSSSSAQIDKASLYTLPQNHRPQLQDFHFLTPNFGLIPAPAPTPSAITSVAQILQSGNKEEESKQKNSFLGSQIVPTPGTQVALWTVTDPDGDALVCSFSLRRDGDESWTDLARKTNDPYVQFDVSHLPDGVYFTRLVVAETAPRTAADRLTTTFETDDLIVDHTPPEIVEASAKRDGDKLVISVHGRDALSLLDGIEAVFNNGTHEETQQPDDGIRDSREETFTLEFPVARMADATDVQVTLYDAVGNATSKRLTW